MPGSKWPCKKKLSLLQESPNSPKEVEKYEVDDSVDHTNHHIEHADKEILKVGMLVGRRGMTNLMQRAGKRKNFIDFLIP